MDTRFEKSFLDTIARRLEEHGLTKIARNQIYRKTNFGRCGLRIGFSKRIYGYDIRAYLFIRYDEVEEIVGRFPLNKFWKETSTIDVELGTYISNEIKTWMVELPKDVLLSDIFLRVIKDIGINKDGIESDIRRVVEEIVDAFETFGLPFLDAYSNSPDKLLELSLDHGSLSRTFSPSNAGKVKRSLVAAWLVNDRRKFYEICQSIEPTLNETRDVELLAFLDLKNYLVERLSDVHGT